MAFPFNMRTAAAGLALLTALGATGVQAAPAFNAAPVVAQATEGVADANLTEVRNRRYHRGYYRHHGGIGPGVALGALGVIAGAAVANSYYNDRYYDDGYYAPRRVYRYYEAPPAYYYAPPPRRYYYRY
ncbi:hypothetical protein [Terrihabitans rhizophilus]|uniref:Transmembrane protein n=1 Tax=Terrihabitans rhizophilus TaxID=3092662 RepID=A0ABU4RLT8_9HYPH|nr:hypothetical protein [Terrihabitans sp. PJ23]MDX6805183.1 hypothetical protein [Terrihabitans sp. PJ23]